MKKSYIIITVVFVACLFGFMLLSVIIPDRSFSSLENRNLQTVPEFSFSDLFDNKLIPALEDYTEDQFPFRDFWVGFKTQLEVLTGKTISNDVYICADGLLAEDYRADTEVLSQNAARVNSFAASHPELKVSFMAVPNSVWVYSDKLPDFASPDDQLQTYGEFASALSGDVNEIEIFGVLSEHKDEYIYFNTDHHWTALGAFYAYSEYAESLGKTVLREDYSEKAVSTCFYGSMYSQSKYMSVEPDCIYTYAPDNCMVAYVGEDTPATGLYVSANLEKKDQYTYFANGNHPYEKILTESESGKKLLLIKDSFAHCLVQYLAADYSEIHMVDLRYYRLSLDELIESCGIDDCLIVYSMDSLNELLPLA